MNRLLIVILFANILNILDVVTTLYAIKVLGMKEANVFMNMFIRFNVIVYIVFKLLALIILSIIAIKTCRFCGEYSYSAYVIGFSIVCLILLMAVINNVCRIIFCK